MNHYRPSRDCFAQKSKVIFSNAKATTFIKTLVYSDKKSYNKLLWRKPFFLMARNKTNLQKGMQLKRWH